jgi:voltage-gated potassium channel
VIGFTSALISQKLKEGTLRLDSILFRDFKDHIVICGWNPGAYMALRELQANPAMSERDVVLIFERAEMPDLSLLPFPGRVHLIQEDFTRISALRRAGIERAAIAIIVTDVSGNRSPQDADARTLLASLTIEKLNSKVVTCAELAASENESHLRMGKVDEVVVTSEISGSMLAQAAISAQSAKLVRHLLHPESASRIQEVVLEQEWVGRTFGDILTAYHKKTGRLPVAVQSTQGRSCLNPHERVLESGDLLLCIVGASELGG